MLLLLLLVCTGLCSLGADLRLLFLVSINSCKLISSSQTTLWTRA